MIANKIILFNIQFQYPAYWMLLFALVAAGVSFWLYYRHNIFSPRQRKILGLIRFLWLFLLLVLLIDPVIDTKTKNIQKPDLVLLADNSRSLRVVKDSSDLAGLYKRLKQITEEKTSGKFNIIYQSFGENLRNGWYLTFDDNSTDLSTPLQSLASAYFKHPPAAFILISDGIYNKGFNPANIDLYSHILYTIGIGDTHQVKNLKIEDVRHNSTVFLGNNFKIEILLKAEQCAQENSVLKIEDEVGNAIFSQNISVNNNSFGKVIAAELKPTKKGQNVYKVKWVPLPDEKNTVDNEFTFYVDVIDIKHKVLIVAEFPHPDISFMLSAMQASGNIEADIDLPYKPARLPGPYDLIIFYQIPTYKTPLQASNVKRFLTTNTARLFIAGTRSNLQNLTEQIPQSGIIPKNNRTHQATAYFNKDFNLFKISDEFQSMASDFPPLNFTFCEVKFNQPNAVMMYQNINGVKTNFPLIWFYTLNETKTGFILGENFWRWKIYSYLATNNHTQIYQWWNGMIQYLASTPGKNRLKIKTRPYYDMYDVVLLEAEFYNDNLQLINDPEVWIEIEKPGGEKIKTKFNRGNQSYFFNAGQLNPGRYSWTAYTEWQGKRYTSSGSFLINNQPVELIETRADFDLLYKMAANNNGLFFPIENFDQCIDSLLQNNQLPEFSYVTHRQLPWHFWPFILIICLILSALEWILRKYWGSL
ncbi:MAG: hypothetical protein KatS3mg034_0542 [Vicingaceae bacterium]|nr:MAG: hypothetical protein KatS3mg034_0542 [Vicingaceae bacterium]